MQAPALMELESYLVHTYDSGDEFKHAFVIYVLGVFLAPTSNGLLANKLLRMYHGL